MESAISTVLSTTVQGPFVNFLQSELESSANTPSLTRTVELLNHSTGSFELSQSNDQLPVNIDATTAFDLGTDFSDYLGPQGQFVARLTWQADGPVLQFPW